MAEELEIKLTLAKKDLDTALAWLLEQPAAHQGKREALVNRYFDTPAAELNRQKVALRIRQAGDRYIQTLKAQGEFVDGAHRRQEWEWELPGPRLNPGLLADTPVAEGINLTELSPVFETNFQRQVVMIEESGGLIEVALDSGWILAKQCKRPLNEVEFELKAGDEKRLLAWARSLAEQVPVFLNLVSKAEQGYYLAGLHQPALTADDKQSLNINRFLQLLGLAWLTGRPFPISETGLALVARQAAERGVQGAYQRVKAALDQGVAVVDLIKAGDLGQLQLAIAGGDAAKLPQPGAG